METRKVQRTGKSTFIVSLPKNWATINSIEAGSIVYISQSDNGALMLSVNRSEQDLTAKLEIGDKSGEPLIRDIIACYVAGHRNIEVSSKHISSAQKRDIHQIVNKLIGPEILEETINKVVIHDLLSSEELQTKQALKRIKNVVRSLIQDSISSLLNNDKDLALDVIQRDDDVDRLNLLIARQFNEMLRSRSIHQEKMNSITALIYMQAASNLERIADHASRIAEMASKCEYTLNAEIAEGLSRLEPIIVELLEDSVSCLLQTDSDKANKIIDKARDIRRHSEEMTNPANLQNGEKMLVGLVVASSIERMLDYIMNLGEMAINLCIATIEVDIDQSSSSR
ncbi:PhoU domain protein [uncultured archaeon]|nr:PhoU domain protein [uncultured archaeon]